MTSAKQLIVNISRPLAYLLPLSLLRKMSGINRLVPVYHAVADETPAHLRYLYGIKSPGQFIADLDLLTRYYEPVSLAELTRLTIEGGQVKKPFFHLTFDDGLSEFYSVVAPILRKKGIPATCFLNNNFIDNKDMLFRLKISLLIDHLHTANAGSSSWVAFHDWVQKYQFGHTYYRKLLMTLSHEDLPKITALAADLQLNFNDYLAGVKPYMTTEQVSELIGQGFTFGAHSFEHVDLRAMEENDQLKEIENSVNDLAARFRLNYKVFSFPFTDFGIHTSFFETVRKNELCTLTFGCAGIKEDIIATSVQRVPVEEYPYELGKALTGEYLYYLFLKLLGKGKMKRH